MSNRWLINAYKDEFKSRWGERHNRHRLNSQRRSTEGIKAGGESRVPRACQPLTCETKHQQLPTTSFAPSRGMKLTQTADSRCQRMQVVAAGRWSS